MTDKSKSRQSRNMKTLLIEPFKQIKLGIYVLLVSLVFTAAFSALFLYASFQYYQHVMEIFEVVDPKFKWDVVNNSVFQSLIWKLGVLLVTFISTLFLIVFRSTHKFYGPLVGIERFVEGITKGEYRRRVVIRKGDELGRLAQVLNEMAQKLEERHGTSLPDRRRRDEEAKSKTSIDSAS